ncbi:MAG: diacylglycerol kinase family protein [Bacillota bacterium]
MSEKGFKNFPKTNNLRDKFGFALAGISYAWATQGNLRIHLAAALMVLMAAFLFRLSAGELVFLIFAIFLVLVAEMFNTAVELAVDLFGPGHHRLAKAAKDVAAGAVLLAVINSVIVGILVFYPHLLALLKR